MEINAILYVPLRFCDAAFVHGCTVVKNSFRANWSGGKCAPREVFSALSELLRGPLFCVKQQASLCGIVGGL